MSATIERVFTAQTRQGRCGGGTVVFAGALGDGPEEATIKCRPHRRLGQHVVGRGSEGLDSYLALRKVQGTNQRYVVALSQDTQRSMLECVSVHAETDVLVRLAHEEPMGAGT